MPGVGQRKGSGKGIADRVLFAVISKTFPRKIIDEIAKNTKKESVRQRLLPTHIIIYYIIALGIFLESSSREVFRQLHEGLLNSNILDTLTTPCKAAISQARSRIGIAPLKELFHKVVKPIATLDTIGAYFKHWKLVTLDGSSIDVADTADNAVTFGYPHGGRGRSGFPKVRIAGLVENGTHVLFDVSYGAFSESETSLAKKLFPSLKKGMLVLADRLYMTFPMWSEAIKAEADLLWRARKNLTLKVEKKLSDGSYLSKIYPTLKDKRRGVNGIVVRVIDYELIGIKNPSEPFYRLITSILDPEEAPALELINLYTKRWTIETVFREIKVDLKEKGAWILRGKKPDLVIQEFYGALLGHFAIRGLMHEAALVGGHDPGELSFTHSARVIRRKMQSHASFSP